MFRLFLLLLLVVGVAYWIVEALLTLALFWLWFIRFYWILGCVVLLWVFVLMRLVQIIFRMVRVLQLVAWLPIGWRGWRFLELSIAGVALQWVMTTVLYQNLLIKVLNRLLTLLSEHVFLTHTLQFLAISSWIACPFDVVFLVLQAYHEL